MRRLALVLVGACSFDHGSRSATPPPADAPPDTPDATPAGTLCGGKVWLADFSTDPTTTPDFAMRDGQPLGGTLAGGVWTETMPRPLDTQPRQPFLTRTLVHVRMRNTTMPQPGLAGAVFWINVDYDGTSFAPLYVDAALQAGGTQTATLFGKSGPSSPYAIAQVAFLDTGMHDYYLDIAPVQHVVTFTVDTLPQPPKAFTAFAAAGNTDEWATVVSESDTTSEFDYLRVEVCP
ncbi:MAG: hypothetical protein ACM31C_10430 [Acidobacteriota bacterium]